MDKEHLNQNYPLVTVGALIFSRSGKFLLVRSHKWNNLYTVPGGKVHLGESCEEALLREIKEETGLEVENVRFVFYQESIYSDQFWKKAHLVMHDYFVDVKPGVNETDVILNDEAQKFIWVTEEESKALPLTRETLKLLQFKKT